MTWNITETGQASSSTFAAFRQVPPQTWTVTAVLQNGVATGFSEPLPTGGDYRICLDPTLRAPDGSTIQLTVGETCNVVAHTAGESQEEEETTTFETVVVGEPEVIPPSNNSPGFVEWLIQMIITIIMRILSQLGGAPLP